MSEYDLQTRQEQILIYSALVVALTAHQQNIDIFHDMPERDAIVHNWHRMVTALHDRLENELRKLQ
jgi:hypothetical protein